MTVESNDAASISTLKSLRSGMNVIASVGGWNFPSAYFSKMVSSSESRGKFISYAKSFLSQHGFVGIDLDWEFPCSPPRDDPVKITCTNFRHVTDAGGNCPADTTNFVTFLKELRAGLGDDMHITVASQAAEKHWVQMGIKEATQYVNQWNVMSYDYAVPDIPGGAAMSPNSPLYTPKSPEAVQMSIDYTIQGYLKAGVPADKIMVGIPFYGHTWYQPGLGTDAWHQFGLNGSIQGECCGPFKQTFGAKPGQACQQCGVMMYTEILAALGGSESGAYHDKDTESDIAYMTQAGQDGYTAAGTWISYSGAKSIAAIIEYTKKNNLAGAFIFDTSMDTGAGGGGQFTLMNQIADGLGKPKDSSGTIYA